MGSRQVQSLANPRSPVNAIEHVIIPRTENTIKCTDSDSVHEPLADKGQISIPSLMNLTEKNSTGSRR